MSWGKWIIVAFVLFGAFIATLVTVCMKQDVSLVSKDYYKEELDYQLQIVRLNNTNKLADRPVIHKSGDHLIVDFGVADAVEKGQLKLFSPSDPLKDRTFSLTHASGQHSFSIGNVAKGMYRAQMQWAMNGKEYYLETVINI